MAFTAADVKALREKTGVGMMECKKALVEADGDMEKAIECLRERGLAAATKKAGRIAAEGIALTYYDEEAKVGVIVEVNCESAPVAKTDIFKNLVLGVAKTIAKEAPADVEALQACTFFGSDRTVTEAFQDAILQIKENMKVRRFERVEGNVATYIHAGGTVGVIVELEGDADAAEVKEMGKNVAMQIAAMNPEYLAKEDISEAELEKIKNITVESALNKPDTLPKPILTKVIAKACEGKLWSDEDVAAYEEQKNNKFLFNFISKEGVAALAQIAVEGKAEYSADPIFGKAIEGRIKKQIKEICLLDQEFVRGDLFEGDVRGYVASVAKKIGSDVKVKGFIRYAAGEGIEKREDDLASEVANMIK